MSEKAKSRLIRYGLTTLVGAVMAFSVYSSRGGFGANESLLDRYRLLSDMFTVPGIMLILFAGLILVSNNGVFDGIGFALSRTVARLIPGRMLSYKDETYRDYVERKHEKGGVTGYSCVVITGAAFLAVGLVFTYLFYQIHG